MRFTNTTKIKEKKHFYGKNTPPKKLLQLQNVFPLILAIHAKQIKKIERVSHCKREF